MKFGVPSLEIIDYQGDNFYKQLKEAISKIRTNPELTTRVVFESGIEQLIFDRLGMRIELAVLNDPEPNAAISIPPVDKNHVFVRPFTQYGENSFGRVISYFDSDKSRIGTVDIHKVRVGGVFSQIPLNLYINTGHFNPAFTDGEIAATILHELGHGFTYFFYLLHSTLCNYISAYTASAVAGANGDKERTLIIEKGLRVMGIDGVGVREFLTQTPEQISTTMQSLYINQTSNQLRSETGFGMYELRACEQLADWFAVRFGAGLELATGMEKLYKDGKRVQLANTMRSRVMWQSALLYGAYLISFTIPFPKIFSEVFRDDSIRIYDRDDDRIKYMRQNLIDLIKDAKLPDAARKDLLKQIDEIKEVEKRVSKDIGKGHSSIVLFLKDKLIPNYRRNVKAVELQKNIEEMLYNEVYVQAAKFQGVSK